MGSEQIRLFGTDGIRGKAGEYPLDDVTIRIIGHSLAAHLAKELGHRPAVVIGRDTRESGARIEQALAFGMASAGADVESAGVITTPGVAYLARSMRFDAGAVISASHNPYQDNGIKVFTQTGKKIPDAWERRIEEDVPVMRRSVYSSYAKSPTAESDTGQTSFVVKANPSYCERYVEYLVKEVAAGLDLHGVRMVIDVANGAASRIAGRVFLALGAEVEILHAQPDGQNINEGCGSLHPENLIEAVKRGRADIGVAFDGDADRALLVDQHGNLMDGDYELMILADRLKSSGRLRNSLVVATVMSNIGLELALAARGIEMVRTNVGDRYVLEGLLARNGSLGGEQSGHIIFTDISLAGDGIITAIEILRALKTSGRTLAELGADLRKYPQVQINLGVSRKPELEGLPGVKGEMDRINKELDGHGRLLVRYSGTENKARIMIEGEDQAHIESQANRLAEILKREIG